MTTKEKWSKLETKVHPEIIKAIRENFGFEYMMPVQKAAIPLFLKNYDLAVQVDFYKLNAKQLGCNWIRENTCIYHPYG